MSKARYSGSNTLGNGTNTPNKVWNITARFATSGTVCFLLNVFILWIGTEILHFHYMGVLAFAWVAVLLVGFILHRNWTFKATAAKTIPQFFRYVAANVGQIALSTLLMYILSGSFHMTPWKASTLIAAGFAVVNFFVHKNWSFSSNKQ